MAFELSKTDISAINDFIADLRLKATEVQTALGVFNGTVHEELSTLNSAVVEYNELLGNARTIIEDARDAAQGEYDDKSERWQEGERGEAVQEWLNELEGLELDDMELYEVEPLANFDPAHSNALEELPTEPSY